MGVVKLSTAPTAKKELLYHARTAYVGYETDDNKEILHDVNLTVQERFVAITGPNGGGKSTLAKVIAGIYQPTSGQILLDGVDITHMSITDRANLGMSYAFQQPVRFKGLRVKRPAQPGRRQEHQRSEACNYLSEVGLCARDYIDREINASLSGGELKRIEIAMVLAAAPSFPSLTNRKPALTCGASRT